MTNDLHREAVCESVAIEDVARRYIPGLERFGGGGWFTGNCPFEDEKDGSFYIAPGRTWRCKGCGRGGDVVDLEFLCGNYSSPSEGPGSEEHTSELQSRQYLVFRLLLEKKK